MPKMFMGLVLESVENGEISKTGLGQLGWDWPGSLDKTGQLGWDWPGSLDKIRPGCALLYKTQLTAKKN